MIRFPCPGCDKKLGIPEAMAGRVAVCPKCKHKFRVPRQETMEAEGDVEERVAAAPRPVRPAPSAKTRRPVEEDDERPAKRSRRPVEEEGDEAEAVRPAREVERDDEDENEPARPIRKRRKKRRRKQSNGIAGMPPLVIVGISVFGVCLVLALASFFVPLLAIVPIGLGWLLMLAGGIWFLVVAFQDNALAGILCLVIPFYSLYYLITNFDAEKKPFMLQAAGMVLLMLGSCAGSFGLPKDMKTQNFRGQPQVMWVAEGRLAAG